MAPKSLDLVADDYHFLSSQFTKPVALPSDLILSSSTVIITGANTGIGYTTAQKLLSLNLKRLIIAVRSLSKGESAASSLRTQYPKSEILVWEVNMLSYKSVQDFAEKCKTLDRIDLAILNAGAQFTKFELGPEGHESSFQINYLSTILLATLLLPTLKVKAPDGQAGRLTIVNSGTSLTAEFPNANDDEVLAFYDKQANFSEGLNPMPSYAKHKALAHFWIYKLYERVSPKDVIVNLVDPGLVRNTSLQQQGNIAIQYVGAVMKWFVARSLEQGADTLVQAGVVLGEESHGCYVMDWRIHHFTKFLHTKEGQAFAGKVWDETYEELPVDVDGILKVL
ncbi:retinol dehydrogenase 11 [Fusarium flagelliforme]|uniref:Retinol dehydrogenase 11 n=1 Tax=Fusarium flagelliforme TaxID=2675880 RepID=A0A395M6K9_9HYPO|nr:retinol dehydrogenase 11 [Fusarium flagelliforme]